MISRNSKIYEFMNFMISWFLEIMKFTKFMKFRKFRILKLWFSGFHQISGICEKRENAWFQEKVKVEKIGDFWNSEIYRNFRKYPEFAKNGEISNFRTFVADFENFGVSST